MLGDLGVMILCYGYIVAMIVVSSRFEGLGVSSGYSRKFLHAMIGNLPFIIPFFSWSFSPFLVAAPFILVTFLASPYSPFGALRGRMQGLADITEEGHHLGLILYAISYTVLASLFPDKPDVIAAGVLPMAYGDSSAAIVGLKYGKRRILGKKTLEGSLAMFTVSLTMVGFSMFYFGWLYSFNPVTLLPAVLIVAVVVAVAELVSTRGYDNIAVPLLGAAAFILTGGGLH